MAFFFHPTHALPGFPSSLPRLKTLHPTPSTFACGPRFTSRRHSPNGCRLPRAVPSPQSVLMFNLPPQGSRARSTSPSQRVSFRGGGLLIPAGRIFPPPPFFCLSSRNKRPAALHLGAVYDSSNQAVYFHSSLHNRFVLAPLHDGPLGLVALRSTLCQSATVWAGVSFSAIYYREVRVFSASPLPPSVVERRVSTALPTLLFFGRISDRRQGGVRLFIPCSG